MLATSARANCLPPNHAACIYIDNVLYACNIYKIYILCIHIHMLAIDHCDTMHGMYYIFCNLHCTYVPVVPEADCILLLT